MWSAEVFRASSRRSCSTKYNGVKMSNTVTLPVVATAPGIFAANASGTGAGLVLNSDYSLNSTANPAAGGSFVIVLATGGGTVQGGAKDGAPAPGAGAQKRCRSRTR